MTQKVKRILLFSIGCIVLAVGLILRIYHRGQAMYFFDDQGGLLITAYDVVRNSVRPLAGPLISVPGWSIPPFNYYYVALFSLVSPNPETISLLHSLVNITGSMALFAYALLKYNALTSLTVLLISMVSVANIEIGRTLWEPHPMFFFVSFYLLLTEIANRRRSLLLYCVGLLCLALSSAIYPTSLLLAPYAYVQTTRFETRGRLFAVFVLGGIFSSVFLPWLYSYARFAWASPFSPSTPLWKFSLSYVVSEMVAYVHMVIYELFQVWFLLPEGTIWREWKYVGFIGMVAMSFVVTSSAREIRDIFIRFVKSSGFWLMIGFFVPAFFGFPMYGYRFIPFYPFLFVAFSRWIIIWVSAHNVLRRVVILLVIVVFLYGNASSWIYKTVRFPRNELTKTNKIRDIILTDMKTRGVGVEDIGVHLFNQKDVWDYYASPLYYTLRVAVNYPVSYTELGNEIDRSKGEWRDIVYLVCDGFKKEKQASHCTNIFTKRWPQYHLIDTYSLSSINSVNVFLRFN